MPTITLKNRLYPFRNIQSFKKYQNFPIICEIDPKYPIQGIKWSQATFTTSEGNTSLIIRRKKIKVIQNQKYTLLMKTMRMKETFLFKKYIETKAAVFNNVMSQNLQMKSIKTNIRNRTIRKTLKIDSLALHSLTDIWKNTSTIAIS